MAIHPNELKDFIRVPKDLNPAAHKSRQFVNVKTGQFISRRAHQEALRGGIRSEEIARIRKEAKVFAGGSAKLRAHSNLVRTYKRKTAAKLGIKESEVKVRGNTPEAIEFREKVKALKKFNEREKKKGIKPHMRTPAQEHELSTLLKDLNFKELEDDTPPNQSPPSENTI